MRIPRLLLLIAVGVPSWLHAAIPAFARRYRVSCQLCHDPIPRLTAFGERFAGNGYRMSPGESPRDTVWTGDSLLALPRELPLAMRVEAYAQAYSSGQPQSDFQTPYNIKLLASGPLSKALSYYMYVNLLEAGEFGGFEDVVLIYNRVAGLPVTASVGQFQVTDVMFKRELRLMFEDYAMYNARVGDEPANLTYDRGLMATADLAGFGLTGELLNGNGIDHVSADRKFDDNSFKNLAGYLTRDLADFLRLGAFGYYGQSDSEGVTNKLTMVGGDATVTAGSLVVRGQFMHREDTNPLFATGSAQRVKTDGGFVEAVLVPPGKRFDVFALYNLVSATAPVLDVDNGGPAGLERYQSITAGLGYLVRRNLRLTGEVSRNLELDSMRWTLGFVTAF